MHTFILIYFSFYTVLSHASSLIFQAVIEPLKQNQWSVQQRLVLTSVYAKSVCVCEDVRELS